MSDVKSRRVAYAELTKAALLKCARELFIQNGFDRTSVDDIARRAQVSKGAVYHHFADKQSIFAELFRLEQAALIERIADGLALTDDPWVLVNATIRMFLNAYAGDSDSRAILHQAISVLGSDRAHQIDEELALPLVHTVLNELVRTGELRALPSATTSQLLFGLLCEAAIAVSRSVGPQETMHEVEEVVLHLLGGLRRTDHALSVPEGSR